MQTILNKNTGELLYTTVVEVELQENEIAVNDLLNESIVRPFYNFETKTFYEGATNKEIEEANKLQVPQIITARQFTIALAILGKNEQEILDGINELTEPTRTIARISYVKAGTFERSNSELIFVGKTFLQMTDEEIDNVFIVGSQY